MTSLFLASALDESLGKGDTPVSWPLVIRSRVTAKNTVIRTACCYSHPVSILKKPRFLDEVLLLLVTLYEQTGVGRGRRIA